MSVSLLLQLSECLDLDWCQVDGSWVIQVKGSTINNLIPELVAQLLLLRREFIHAFVFQVKQFVLFEFS